MIRSLEQLDTSALLSPWKLAALEVGGYRSRGATLRVPEANGRMPNIQHAQPEHQGRLLSRQVHAPPYVNQGGGLCCQDGSRGGANDRLPRYILSRSLGNAKLILAWFVNTGFTCIASILEGVKAPPASQGMQETLGVVGEQLRLLAHVVELARDNPAALPVVDAVVQDSFIKALASKIQAFEAALARPAPVWMADKRWAVEADRRGRKRMRMRRT